MLHDGAHHQYHQNQRHYADLKLQINVTEHRCCIVLTVSELWEIPVALFLSERFGMIVNLFVCLFITVSGVVISQTRIWYVLVSAIPMRVMCPLLHVLPNGLAAEAGNSLLDTGVIVPGMCLSIIWLLLNG